MPLPAATSAPVSLHLTGCGKLSIDNGRLLWSIPDRRPVRIDLRRLRTLCLYGHVSVSEMVLHELFVRKVDVAWLTPGGRRCRGRLIAADSGHLGLRIIQHRAWHSPARIVVARRFVAHKLDSQLDALRRFQRNGRPLPKVAPRLEALLEQLPRVADLPQLRGVEGTASRLWFQAFAALLEPPWSFPGRVKRPPTDPVNALLSLGYTWLVTRVAAQIEARGLELQLGFLHDPRPGRPALACDVVEPLRVPIVDRWVLRLCRRGGVQPDDFTHTAAQGTRLTPQRFQTLLSAWETHLVRQRFTDLVDDLLHRLERTLRDLVHFEPGEVSLDRSGLVPPEPTGAASPGDDRGPSESLGSQT